ncbi:lipopolysaccharide biosynthesis protein [Altererythrobacter sp. SALINAS58]|uniref:lipopolysaccharide biosynthesis protein n=1 Tax=Alteripontixanthobacter muriae TaxID=2705546 RepID=UPI0015755329|nr:lipopolysaccharide biosynthesis protein [Alteripontixanthobacter muriae]NTZ42133.1 lipopolysaccharide biosynthesis protein [Alteripontixanthobacter muriae]
MKSMKGSLLKGASWLSAVNILSTALGFVSTLVLARLLVPEDFGIVAIAVSIAGIAETLTHLSLSQALLQNKNPEEHHFDTAWTLGLARSVLIGLAFVAVSEPLAQLYGDARLTPVILVLAMSTALGGLASPRTVVFERNLVFWHRFVLDTISRIIGFAVSLTIALVYESYWALVLGVISSQISRVALSYVLAPYVPKLGLKGCKALISFSGWMTAAGWIGALNSKSDALILGAFVSPTLLGFYSMGERVVAMTSSGLIQPVGQLLFPAFSRIQDDRKRLNDAYLRSQALICMLAFPAGAGLSWLADPAITLALGEKWSAAIPIVQVFAITSALLTIQHSQPLAMALGQTKAVFARHLRIFLVRMPLYLGGILMGEATAVGALMGAVYGHAASQVINLFWNMTLVKQLSGLGLYWQFRNCCRSALATAVMIAALYLLQQNFTFGTSAAAEAAYVGGTVLVGALTYGATLALIWLAQKRPSGPESELFHAGQLAAARIFIRDGKA